jgi:Type II secretion system (T2SS), protein E, N-terminal domain/HEAT repeats
MTARLEDVLVARGLLSSERVTEAMRDHALGGGQLDTVFLEVGGLSERELLSALAEASDVQPLHLGDYEPNVAMAEELPSDIAERLDVVPVSAEGTTLHVASAYPVPELELQALGALRHRRIVPWVAVSSRVRDWLHVLYGLPIPAREAAVLAALEPHRPLPVWTPAPVSSPELDEGLTLEELLAKEVFGLKPETAEVAAATPEAAARPSPPPPLPKAEPSPPARSRTARDFPMMGTSAFPLAPPAVAPAPASTEVVVEWTLEEARTALRAVTSDRDGIKDVALRYGRRTFDYLAAFAVVRGKAVGWDALGEGADRSRLQQLSVPLDVPSLFRTAALAHTAYAGPVPKDALTKDVLHTLRRAPRTVFLHPVEVKGRLVAMVYGDRAGKPVSQRRLADFRLFCQELSGAFSELLVQRRQLASSTQAPTPQAPAAVATPSPRPKPTTPPPLGEPRPLGWAPSVRNAPDSLGRAITRPGLTKAEEARPPPDFRPLLEKLLGTDAAQRARAMAEMARTPEPAARVLAAAFPGPTAWSRVAVEELPEADELGPIPGALVRLGRHGADALATLLDAADPDTRYFALLCAGNTPFPEVVAGVLRGLFDLVPELSSAARLAARALRKLPRFTAAMPSLRQELAARDPMRRILAARALGALRDREAVEGLIGLTGSDDVLCAEAAAEALAEITRASFGMEKRAWVAWWAENRRRSRVQWLLAALRHKDVEVRRAAAEELIAALGETLGYAADAPEKQREPAVKRWELALPDARLRPLN